MVALGAYIMTKSQPEQIQQSTGVDPEEMTDEELAKAMDDLSIPKEEVTDADQDA